MRYRGTRLAVVAILALMTCAAARAHAQKVSEEKAVREDTKTKYVRLVRDPKTPVALQTAIVRFVPKDSQNSGLTVDLVAAIHVADKGYFEQLNRRFRQYDAVLYELVAPEGTRIPKGGAGASSNPVSMIQNLMTKVLDLEFQLRGIDYTAKNFVHADLSPEQFAKSMERRGESVWTIMLRMMAFSMAQQGGDEGASDAKVLMALFDKNRALALKRLMAEQFQDMEGALDALWGPDGSALISDRNEAALRVLRQQIDGGKKRIAVFYGGGHMPEFEKELRKQFGLVPSTTEWLVAWDMKK